MEFVNRQARIATDLISSLQSIKNDQPGVVKDKPVLNRRHPHYSHDGQTFVTIHGEQNKDNFTRKEKCILCQDVHVLDTCMSFRAMNLMDRKQFAKEKRLCFTCLHYGHVS